MRARGAKIWILSSIIVAEALAIVVLARKPLSFTEVGFLSKQGRDFLVSWKDQGAAGYEMATFDALPKAIHFLEEDLGLLPSSNTAVRNAPEKVWVHDRYGTFVVLWKLEGLSMVSQMTFQKQGDAHYFADAFRRGEYSPSPVGHAVRFRPLSSR